MLTISRLANSTMLKEKEKESLSFSKNQKYTLLFSFLSQKGKRQHIGHLLVEGSKQLLG
jgi:hypothetical protein